MINMEKKKISSRGGARVMKRPKKEHGEWRYRYGVQKCHAKIRKIEWNLTFEEWFAWWGDDIHKRGKGKDDLVMARYGDIGPYSLDNIYKTTFGDNAAFKRSEATCKKMSESQKELFRQKQLKE